MVALLVASLLIFPLAVGHLVYRAFAPRQEEGTLGEVLFTQVMAGFLLCGWPALILAEFGLLSLPLLAGLLLLGCAVVAAVRWRHIRSWRWPRPRPDRRGFLTVALFLGVAALMLRPGERILGANDPGVYLATAASIARTGGIVLYDPAIASMPPQARTSLFSHFIDQWWQLPGFYITDLDTGQVTPQFFHLYPTWLALFYAAGGLSFTLAAFPLFTLLGLGAFFFLARRLLGEWAGPVAMVLLALNPAQVWFSRDPAAEPFAMALLLGGWYLFDRAMRQPDRRELAVLAGLSLGQIALAKLELLILPMALAGYFLVRSTGGRIRSNERSFLLTYTLMLAHGAAHAALISRPYLQNFLTSLEMSRFIPGPILAGLATAAIAAAVVLFALRKRLAPLLNRLGGQRQRLRDGISFSWWFLVLYGAVVRPLLARKWVQVQGEWVFNYERVTFLRLAWYLSPLGLLLAALGLAWWLRRRLEAPSVPFVVTLLAELTIYIHRTMDLPLHFWMIRRYVPLIFPCLTLGIAASLLWLRRVPLSRPVRRGGSMALLGLLIFQAVQADVPLSSRRELAGTVATLEKVASKVPDGAPLFVEQFGPAFATPLRYHFGREAYALLQPVPWDSLWSMLREWPREGGDAYLLLEHLPAYLPGGVSLTESGGMRLEVWGIEASFDHLPHVPLLLGSTQRLYRVQQHPDTPYSLRVGLASPSWTSACMTITLPATAAPLRLQVSASGFRPQNVPSARLWVVCQGQRIAEVGLERSRSLQEVELILLLPLEQGGSTDDIVLTICTDTWNPKAVGYGDDDRDLGIMLRSLLLEPTSPVPR